MNIGKKTGEERERQKKRERNILVKKVKKLLLHKIIKLI